MNKVKSLVALALWSVASFAYAAEFSDLMVVPRWPVSPLVDVYYTMSGAQGTVDVAFTFTSGGKEVKVSKSALSGDCENVSNGMRHVVWDPRVDTVDGTILKGVKVAPKVADILYMIVDLTKNTSDPDLTKYVGISDLQTGEYGAVVTNPVAGINSVVWSGVTENDIYKTSKMVFRKVSPGTVHDDAANIDLNNPKSYWIAVFEVTQEQMKNIAGSYVSRWNTPTKTWAATQTFNYLRGETGIAESSFVSLFREKTGLNADLPTELQWRYAARAGATKLYTDNVSTTEKDTAVLYELGNLYGSVESSQHFENKPVGSFKPNAWGLYDVLGNVAEWVLDGSGGNHYLLGSSRAKSDLSYAVLTSGKREAKSGNDSDGFNLNGFRLIIER